jgi:hypothetical protein
VAYSLQPRLYQIAHPGAKKSAFCYEIGTKGHSTPCAWRFGVYAARIIAVQFIDPKDLTTHFGKHGPALCCRSESEYEAMAKRFLSKARTPTMMECVRRPQGYICRYDYATQEYGVIHCGRIYTYFRPVPGAQIPRLQRPNWMHEFACNLDYFYAKCSGGAGYVPLQGVLLS